MKPENNYEKYLGDGLYASFDGYQIRLWCERFATFSPIHEVFLEPNVLATFLQYVQELNKLLNKKELTNG